MKEQIYNLMQKAVANLMYYDRKEDDDIPRGAIEGAIERGEITVDEIVAKFREELEKGL